MSRPATARAVTLVIPGTCPSVNALLSGKLRRRIETKHAWKHATWVYWYEAGKPTFSGPVTVTVRLYFETKRKRDWPNFMAGGVKCIVDQLVAVGCIVGDDDAVLDMQRPEMLYDRVPRVELTITEAT